MPPPRLLMIDDDPGDFAAVAAAFGSLAELTLARHAGEALDLLGPARDRFDLILLDQEWNRTDVADALLVDAQGRLPAIGPVSRLQQGEAVLRLLRGQQVRVPVVFCSRVEDPRTALRLCAAGARDFLAKRDVLTHPEWVLHLFQNDAADRALLRRLLRRHGVVAGRPAVNWLLSQRTTWARQWAALAGAVIGAAAGHAGRQLTPGTIAEIERGTLPRLLVEHRERVTAADLRRLVDDRADYCRVDERGLWLGAAADRLLAVVEPAAVVEGVSLPADWSKATEGWRAGCPFVRPTTLREVFLGPNDPFWGGPRLVVAETGGPAWALGDAPGVDELATWQARAGRVGAPGAAFWQGRQGDLAALRAAAGDRPALVPGLLAVALPDAGRPAGAMELLPVPSRLLALPGRSPERLLLLLHAGPVQADAVPERLLAHELARLPRVELRRSGWLNAFEEESLRAVLGVLSELRAEPAVVWAGCDFLHVRLRRTQNRERLTVHAREYDIVLLTRQGVLVLECKSSVLPRDFEHGHVQVKEAREMIWASIRGQPRGGIFLRDVLLNRLHKATKGGALPADLLDAVPDDLATRLQGRGLAEARAAITAHYAPLASVSVNPSQEPDPDEFTTDAVNKLPAVVGFVVAPREGRVTCQGRPLGQQPFVLGCDSTLGKVLRGWLRRRPVFTQPQVEQVRSALAHMSRAAEADGLVEIEGFQGDGVYPRAGWRHLHGHSLWTEMEHTWLVRPLTEVAAGPRARQALGHWFVAPLRNLTGELRWLDRRGLPATHPRHLHRVGISLPGQVFGLDTLTGLPLPTRLEGAIALLELALTTQTQEALGLSDEEPVLLAQQLPGTTALRWGWLPGLPLPRPRHPGDARHGLRRTFPPLLALLDRPADDPAAAAARRAVQVTAAQVETESPRPHLDRLLAALRGARELA